MRFYIFYKFFAVCLLVECFFRPQIFAKQSRDLDGIWSYDRKEAMVPRQIASVFYKKLSGSNTKYSAELATAIGSYVSYLCRKYNFDPAFVLALIDVESSFRVDAVSHANAIGLMQIQPETARFAIRFLGLQKIKVGNTIDAALKNPFINLRLGIAYLGFLRDRYQGDVEKILAAYNAGPAVVDRLIKRNSIFEPIKTRPFIVRVLGKMPYMKRAKIEKIPTLASALYVR